MPVVVSADFPGVVQDNNYVSEDRLPGPVHPRCSVVREDHAADGAGPS